ADKGLCGAYNSGIIKFSHKEIEKQKEEKEFILLGLKIKKALAKKKLNVVAEFINWTPTYAFARQIARTLAEKFVKKEIDEVNCYYVKNITSLTQEPRVEKILPIKTADKDKSGQKTARAAVDYIFEPSIEKTLNLLLKKYLEVVTYSILIESKVSELSARLRAMSSATNNADKLSGELKLQYFRARQESITNELLEIVGGVEALKK
ncbi:MAG: FoF1 ATP synthase subunit gamma, partial [Pseudomonadota bacterium]